jgi:Dehydrogenases (flavoproteins)
MKKIRCDVVVVGAGPGGSMAAKTCAKYGLDTVLIERKEYPSKPNCITCLVGPRIFEYVKIDKKTISSSIYRAAHFSPDGTEVSTPYHDGYDFAYVLNRKTFDNEVLKLALKEGPEYMNKTRVTGLIRENGQLKGVKAKIDEREDVEIRSNIVIGADGVESKVGKWAGIYKGLDVNDLCVILDGIVDEVDMDEEEYHTWRRYYGYKDIPNLMFASYPQGYRRRTLSITPLFYPLIPKKGEFINGRNCFLKNNPLFSKSKLIEWGGGCIPVHPLKNFVTDGVMLVGDAARQTNMPSAVIGILHAMDAGVLAGETAVEAHEDGDFSSNLLSRYEQRWYRLHGERDFLGYFLLRIALSLYSEDSINILFHLLGESDTATFTDEIFETFAQSPKFTSKLIYKLKKEGLDIPDMLSFASLLKKHHRNYWDTFVE